MRFEFGAQSMEVMILSCYTKKPVEQRNVELEIGVLLKESLVESNRGRCERESGPR